MTKVSSTENLKNRLKQGIDALSRDVLENRTHTVHDSGAKTIENGRVAIIFGQT